MLSFVDGTHAVISVTRSCSSARSCSLLRSTTFPRILRAPKAKYYSTTLARHSIWPKYALALATGFASSVAYALLQEKRSKPKPSSATFSSYILDSKTRMSSTSSIFTFIPISKPAGNDIHDAAWREGVWSVQIRQPQLQIARAYTPLPPIAGIGDDSISSALRFLIRQDPNGEVSGYLHKLPQGAIIDLRGPHIEYNVPADVYEVLFLAGGTGIAPALQVAHALYHMRKEAVVDPKMHILLANRRREDCAGGISDTQSKASSWLGAWISTDTSRPVSSASSVVSKDMVFSPLVQYLEQLKLKQGGQLSVDYFVDEERTFINQEILRRQLQSNSDPAAPQSKGKRLILVSGPDGFVEYLAGPKVWQNGKELQGPLGGLLGQMKISGWEVWKL